MENEQREPNWKVILIIVAVLFSYLYLINGRYVLCENGSSSHLALVYDKWFHKYKCYPVKFSSDW